MGFIGKLLSLIPVSDRTEVQFHRIHTVTTTGEPEMVTYIDGDVVVEPTVVGSTVSFTIPEDTVLIEHKDEPKHVKINGKPYPVYEYTLHAPADVPSDIQAKPIPPNLQGVHVQKRDLEPQELEMLEEVLP